MKLPITKMTHLNRKYGAESPRLSVGSGSKKTLLHSACIAGTELENTKAREEAGQSLGNVIIEHFTEEFVKRHLPALLHGEPIFTTQEFQVHQGRQAEEEVAQTTMGVGKTAHASVLDKSVLETIAEVLNEVGTVHFDVCKENKNNFVLTSTYDCATYMSNTLLSLRLQRENL